MFLWDCLVDILLVVTIVIWWNFLLVCFGVFLACSEFVEAIADIEDRKVLVLLCEEHSLNLNKQLLTVLTDEAVVVFVFNVDHKVKIICYGGAGERPNSIDLDCALEVFLLDVG